MLLKTSQASCEPVRSQWANLERRRVAKEGDTGDKMTGKGDGKEESGKRKKPSRWGHWRPEVSKVN